MTIFILHRNEDLSVHDSVREAESWMESPDIQDGEYLRAFDEKGNIFSIGCIPTKKTKGWFGIIGTDVNPGILTPTGENASSELHKLVRECLTDNIDNSLSLDDLVALVVRKRNAKPRGFFLNPRVPR